MQKTQIRIKEPYVVVVVNYLNLLLGAALSSKNYYQNELLSSLKDSFFYHGSPPSDLKPTLLSINKERLFLEMKSNASFSHH
jgi:hypothetical protein